MKLLSIKNLFGGLGLEVHTIGGHIGVAGTQAAAMEDMDTIEAVVEDILVIGEDKDLGVVVVEEHTLAVLVVE
jgi:hypothetical protein